MHRLMYSAFCFLQYWSRFFELVIMLERGQKTERYHVSLNLIWMQNVIP